jgi:hypothetical protein
LLGFHLISKILLGLTLIALERPQPSAAVQSLIASETVTPPFIRFLKVGALQARVTLHFNVPRVHLYLGMDDSPVSVSEIVMNDTSIRTADLVSNLVTLYLADIVISSPSLLGSLQILGNPTSFVSNVVDGVYDLLAMPMEGVRERSALNAVLGVGRGSASFVRHLSVGTLKSFSGLFASLSKNMDALTMDEAYVLRHIRERTVASRAGLGNSLMSGFAGLGSAVVEGLVGVVAQPIQGAQQGGVRGFFVGSALGALNVLLKPLGGAVELVSRASQGALASVGGGPFSERRAPNQKRRQKIANSDIKWRRKVLSLAIDTGKLYRAFDCVWIRAAESDGKVVEEECAVLLFERMAFLVSQDLIMSRQAFSRVEYKETFAQSGESVFVLGDWTLRLKRFDRRDFSVFLHDNLKK